jgi:ubiquitin-protein ligase E3 C
MLDSVKIIIAHVGLFYRAERLWHLVKTCEKELLRELEISIRVEEVVGVPPALGPLCSLLYLFSSIFYHQLSGHDDEEVFESNKTLLAPELPTVIRILKACLQILYWSDKDSWHPDNDLHTRHSRFALLHLQLALTRLFNHLYIRNERRHFLEPEDWVWNGIGKLEFTIKNYMMTSVDREEGLLNHAEFTARACKAVLLCVPQVVTFTQRVALFQHILGHDRSLYQNEISAFTGPAARIQIRRSHIFLDSLVLNSLGANIKKRVQIEFVSEQGYAEAGIDGGGLFKEYMDSFCRNALSPERGLFQSTPHHTIMPSTMRMDQEEHYFTGKMIGKAIYEVIL